MSGMGLNLTICVRVSPPSPPFPTAPSPRSTGTGLTMDPFSFGGAKHANEDRRALSPKHDAEHTEAQFDEYAAGGIGIIANITRGLDDDDLPTGWAQVHDPESGHAYFYNENTGESTWDRPAGSLSE